MIVLDTNIVSEFMGSPPAPAVRAWLNGQDTTTLHITAVTVAEIKLGLRTMPAGKRRRLLDEQFERFHAQAFPSRVLPFDEGAADAYADIRARRSRAGRPVTLCVEISEQRLVGDPSKLAERLRPFQDAGIEVAIDDLGFGRSSLEVLLVVEPKIVKIDRRYITGVSGDPQQSRLLRRFLTLVRGAGATAIAEGVETREDMTVLRDMGVPLAQGFLWGKPE